MAIFSDLAQVMQNARTDAKTLDNYIHGAADTQVTSRLGKRYWTLATLDNKLSLVKIKAETTLADIDTLAKSTNDALTAKSNSANAALDSKVAQANSDISTKVANANAAIDSKVAAIDTRADAEIGNLQDAINTAAAAGAGANGWTATLIDAESGLNQRQINNGLNTIAELIALINPVNGQRVYVKGYYAATNLALAQPYVGGGEFIYDSTKINENDGVLNFNGWVRQNITEVTPEMAGAKSDGITDDRFACEKSIIAANKLNVKWVLPKYSNCLLNSYAAINNYSAILL